MSLATDNDVLAYVQVNDRCLTESMRQLVKKVRQKAENLVKQYVGYNIERATYVEYLPAKTLSIRAEGDLTSVGFDLIGGTVVPRSTFPTSRREIVLQQLPVWSIEAAYDNPAAYNTAEGDWPTGSQLPTNAYFLDRDMEDGPCWSGILYRNVGSWGIAARSIRIEYTAGLTAQQLATEYTEFNQAVLVTCAKMLADIAARSNMVRTGAGPVASVSVQDFAASFSGTAGMIGAFLGTGVGTAALPTEAAQWVAHRRHPATLF